MKIISREELNEKLKSIGIVKSSHYEATAEYNFRDSAMCDIDIDDVEDADKEKVVSALIDALLVLCDSIFVFPRYTYFADEQEGAYFHSFGMKSLKEEAIEWTKEDIDLINKIVSVHFVKGWYLGWDLYLATSDGSILILVCHHNEFHIEMSSKETGRKFSKVLSEMSVEHELFLSD